MEPNVDQTNEPGPQDLFVEGVRLHQRGVDGDLEAVPAAYAIFQQISAAEPENTLALAYLGSATALIGRDALDPQERMKMALRGVKILDRAVSRDPENADIRVLRGFVCLRLPEMFFHRTATAVEDFQYLAGRYEADQQVFARELYWQILYQLSVACQTLGRHHESRAALERLKAAGGSVQYGPILKQEGI